MAEEMKFMDAGRKVDYDSPVTAPSKTYPRFTVDLDQFPGLECDVDECVELHLKGRVSSRNHSDYGNTMEVEVTSIAVPSHTHETIGPMNEADKALGKMKTGARY